MNNRDPAKRAQPVRGVGSPVTVRDIGRDPEALDVFYRQHLSAIQLFVAPGWLRRSPGGYPPRKLRT